MGSPQFYGGARLRVVGVPAGCKTGIFAPAKPSATAEDIAKFGPGANERITKMRAEILAGPGGDPIAAEHRAAELAKAIQNERDPLVRAQIVRTIEIYKSDMSVAVLHAAIGDPDYRVRIAAADSWGKRGGPEGIEHLDKMLKADEHADVRLSVVKAMGATKDRGRDRRLGPCP
ncbi:MAG: HEAT repeat domain-containing protein [Pirellulales bacterium]